MKFEIERDELLKLKENNYDAYQLIMSMAVDSEVLYRDSLDMEQLKSECEKGYFEVADLFTKEQIADALGANITINKVNPECLKPIDHSVIQEIGFDSFGLVHVSESATPPDNFDDWNGGALTPTLEDDCLDSVKYSTSATALDYAKNEKAIQFDSKISKITGLKK